MTETARTRNPWAVAAIAFLLGTVSGMCYLGRGKIALAYFASIVTLIILLAFFLKDKADLLLAAVFTVQSFGFVHCMYIALKRGAIGEGLWYSHWPMVLLAMFPLTSPQVCAFRHYVYEPYNIPTGSMSPTLNVGAYVWVKRSAYLFSYPQRGDIVVFRHPKRGVNYIKRIIGLPGDVIQIRDGIVYINAAPVSQKPSPGMLPEGVSSPYNKLPRFTEKLPEGKEYSVLIAARNLTQENTSVYVVPDHDYFVMGDNRDNSRDSRFADCGFIPEGNILGKATVTWWNGPVKEYNPTPVN